MRMKNEFEYKNNLENLSKKWSEVGYPDEDKIFEEIEELENKSLHREAANLLSIYISFAAHRTHKIRMEAKRECVKLLLENNLVSFIVEKLDEESKPEIVLISKIVKSGIQNIHNYTI